MPERPRRTLRAAGLALLLGGALALGGSGPVQPTLHGDLDVHDPTLLPLPGGYLVAGTGFEDVDGGALRLKTSADGITWRDAGPLLHAQPGWVKALLGSSPPNLWAPNLTLRRTGTGARAFLYFSASTFGRNASGIGLMTNDRLTLARPAGGWQDRGLVLASRAGDDFNAIDPARLDARDGRAWLVYGSYWDGIRLRELDPEGGLLRRADTPTYRLASRAGGPVEAASLLQRGPYTYLFVSFDRCCAGLASTYRIMVGRARDVKGPYLDRAGRPMLQGGGTELLATGGRVTGPGGQEAYRDGAQDRLVYHQYDRERGGTSQLQTTPLLWDEDGWPHLPPPPGGTP
ncbi:arabinan endo-1,5-alpha-L-arabinosidase [Deinococcus aquiradiocola]|uniref:Arabinan endo-1,5-alpha-L-arabinosidase n=1 Tax=Deinococcus aquiradiocola TaxID=393059 RepID=A0A917PBS4_9DEIO|nr:arabinan endo-1,5-alpha-L-arabinosidase [Deinococcus aquiradiocola]GGJ70051.1 arabinan endo-1,5-alpha-L-arabinosidase [Deinococcus aquiradiocola]